MGFRVKDIFILQLSSNLDQITCLRSFNNPEADGTVDLTIVALEHPLNGFTNLGPIPIKINHHKYSGLLPWDKNGTLFNNVWKVITMHEMQA